MRRVLFIGINYYAYVTEIRAAFARLGCTVDYFPIEQAGFFSKALKKAAGPLHQRQLDAHHRKIIAATANIRYDDVLFIQVHQVSHDNMALLRTAQPQARFTLYNWDSLNTHDYRPWLRHFDRVVTFDPADALQIGADCVPLFAVPAFYRIDHDRPKDFDLYFVGTMVSLARFEALERLHTFAAESGLRLKFHLKCGPPMRFRLWRMGKHLPGLTGASLGFGEIIDLVERSHATFDFANHRQAGYTMRFIENLAAGRKIVTEDARVVSEPFYREDRILVVKDQDYSAVPAFLSRPIASELDVVQFGVDRWAEQVLGTSHAAT